MGISDYLSLFPGASREKPRFMALAEAVLTQAVDLQSLADMLLPGFSFALAEGKQLDMLAAAEGLGREDHTPGAPLADGDFRVYLLAKHALWAWDGTNRGVPETLSAGLPGSRQADNMDGTVTLAPASRPPAPPEALFPVPAGIQIQLEE